MDTFEILFLLAVGVGMGFSLMGMSTSILFAPIILSIYGSRLGNGIMIIPFIVADIYVTYLYRKSYDWKVVVKLLPCSFLGMLLAGISAKYISEQIFQYIIAFIIIFASIMFFLSKYEEKLKKLGWLFGILGGAASYLANVAGPILNVFFLAYEKDTKSFIGTRAMLFTVLNLLKLVLYILFFNNINMYTLSRGAIAIPTIFIGTYLAKQLIKHINQKTFNKIVVFLGLLVAIKMLF